MQFRRVLGDQPEEHVHVHVHVREWTEGWTGGPTGAESGVLMVGQGTYQVNYGTITVHFRPKVPRAVNVLMNSDENEASTKSTCGPTQVWTVTKGPSEPRWVGCPQIDAGRNRSDKPFPN